VPPHVGQSISSGGIAPGRLSRAGAVFPVPPQSGHGTIFGSPSIWGPPLCDMMVCCKAVWQMNSMEMCRFQPAGAANATRRGDRSDADTSAQGLRDERASNGLHVIDCEIAKA
jgi:hypothetical protein